MTNAIKIELTEKEAKILQHAASEYAATCRRLFQSIDEEDPDWHDFAEDAKVASDLWERLFDATKE
jgi:hypothetical protein